MSVYRVRGRSACIRLKGNLLDVTCFILSELILDRLCCDVVPLCVNSKSSFSANCT